MASGLCNVRLCVHNARILLVNPVGLKSLQDPIDTTTAQGRLIFNIFASLAEFERDLIRERTNAGLQVARARGRMGGRPKGLSAGAHKKAIAAEALYVVQQGRRGDQSWHRESAAFL